jgi:hypothetical protein
MCYFWLVICVLPKKVPSTKTYRLVSQSTFPVNSAVGPNNTFSVAPEDLSYVTV